MKKLTDLLAFVSVWSGVRSFVRWFVCVLSGFLNVESRRNEAKSSEIKRNGSNGMERKWVGKDFEVIPESESESESKSEPNLSHSRASCAKRKTKKRIKPTRGENE